MALNPNDLELARQLAQGILAAIRLGANRRQLDLENEAIMEALPDDTTDAERYAVQKSLLGMADEVKTSS